MLKMGTLGVWVSSSSKILVFEILLFGEYDVCLPFYGFITDVVNSMSISLHIFILGHVCYSFVQSTYAEVHVASVVCYSVVWST